MLGNKNDFTKVSLIGKSLKDLKNIVRQTGLPAYTSNQLADWLYKKYVGSIDDMTNLSKPARLKLNQRFDVGLSAPIKTEVSEDGTKKYLFKGFLGNYIETVFIPDEERNTLCVSSQAGCKMACDFCMTGKQGFQGNLEVEDIINQFISVPERDLITNIVFMGMGEPLDNLDNVLKALDIFTSDYGMAKSPRRITVSTIGLLKEIKEFLEKSECHLALSLHNPFDEERGSLVPVQKTNPVSGIMEIIKSYDWKHQRRVSFEYIMFKGLNDTDTHLRRLIKLLSGLYCRVNLIRFHKIPGVKYIPSEDIRMIKFRDSLSDVGITSTIRQSRGEDISAACGMLSTLELNKK